MYKWQTEKSKDLFTAYFDELGSLLANVTISVIENDKLYSFSCFDIDKMMQNVNMAVFYILFINKPDLWPYYFF